jgi:hypothetical protein
MASSIGGDAGWGSQASFMVILHIQFGVVWTVLTVSKHVMGPNIFLEALKVNWVNVLSVKGDAEAETMEGSVQRL